MNKKKIIRGLTFVFLLSLLIIDKYVADGFWKDFGTLLAFIGAIYSLANQFFPKSKTVKGINRFLRKYHIGRLLIGEEILESAMQGAPFNHFKREVLLYTKGEINKRSDFINSPEIFCFDFEDFEEFNDFNVFTPGDKPDNKSKTWQQHYETQFSFITGNSGSGKTFELIKRAQYACNQLAAGEVDYKLLENRKIPIYIELKSLDQFLDKDWIIEYLQKTAQIANIKLEESQLRKLLENNSEVIYFFDGIDEVPAQFRAKCVETIAKEFTNTGVHVTCRKTVYNQLARIPSVLPLKLTPAELFLKPLNIEMINKIIHLLPNLNQDEKENMRGFISRYTKILEHLSRPIFLNLFMIGFPNLTNDAKLKLGNGELNVLWENYEDVIVKKKLPKDADVLGLRTTTIWIAKIMREHSFYIESIQPNWLWEVFDDEEIGPSIRLQKLYFVSTRTFAAMIIGIAMGFILATPFTLLTNSIIGGFTVSALAGIYRQTGDKKGGQAEEKDESSVVKDWLFSIVMLFTLIIVCGVYQGLSIPRNPAEMMTPYFSMAECWSGILLGVSLSSIFSYRIIMEKNKRKYILPIEIFHFDWPHAIRYGIFWGGATGLIAGAVALYVKHKFENHIFIKNWLIPYLDKVSYNLRGIHLLTQQQDLAVFSYAFFVVFFVSSIIIVLMAGRFNDAEEKDVKKKQELNFGIVESGKHALLHALNVALFCCGIYAIVMLWPGMGSWYFCIKIAIGISLLAFLWFGGMEVINHRLLRLNLYIRGIAPLNYKPWVQALQSMGIIIPTGYQLKFYHATLAEYYMDYPVKNNPRVRIQKGISTDIWIYGFLIIMFIIGLSNPFARRYYTNTFWESPYDITMKSQGFVKDSSHSYLVKTSGFYKLAASGYSNVGTFVGYVAPQGTTLGFMGMPIDSAYNISGFEKYRHAALLYRVKGAGIWSGYKYSSEGDTLVLHSNDRLEFIVNDKEWQNNIGRYEVSLTLIKKKNLSL